MENTNMAPGVGSGSHGSVMTIKITGKLLTAAVIFLFLIMIFAVFLCLYAKKNWIPMIASYGRANLIITAADAPIPRRGLGADVLRSLPVTVFRRSDFKDGIECSVCLCGLSEGEKVRLLPKCSHGFHLDCIDMWLHSHFTCPLCRCPVAAAAGEDSPAAADGQLSSELYVLPSNVLFWGNNGRFSTRGVSAHSVRSLMLTIPNRSADGFPSLMSPLGSSRCSGENVKSPVEEARSPGTSKFGSLRRILSRGKRTDSFSCNSPVEGDIEQGLVRCGEADGEGSSDFPKIPIST